MNCRKQPLSGQVMLPALKLIRPSECERRNECDCRTTTRVNKDTRNRYVLKEYCVAPNSMF